MKQFKREFEVIADAERSTKWVEGHEARIRLHRMPFFGKLGLSQITAGKVQDYRIQRMKKPESWDDEKPCKAPARSTIHDEIVALRQVMNTALRHQWVSHLPDFTAPYRAAGKISHRAWFSLEKHKTLYTATRANIEEQQNKHLAAHPHD